MSTSQVMAPFVLVVILICPVLSVILKLAEYPGPVASAPAGNFLGIRHRYQGVDYYGFIGIKYGETTRFKLAEKVQNRSRDRVESSRGDSPCLQFRAVPNQFTGSSDCLLISIYSPSLYLNGSFPVIFYIHGGAFNRGFPNTYTPDFLMTTKRVVFVVPNYRHGPLGFLDFNTRGYPSNLGIRDLILALEWVKENIRAFGGDPNRITVMGNSAGAVMANILTKSPLTKDMTFGGISLSGTSCAKWAVVSKQTARYGLVKYAQAANCPIPSQDSTAPAIATILCLQRLSEKELHRAAVRLQREEPFLIRPFSPVLEGPGVDSIIPEYMWRVESSTPYLYFTTTDEGTNLLSALQLPDPIVEKAFKNGTLMTSLPLLFLYNDSADDPKAITEKLISFYLDGANLTIENLKPFLALVTRDIMHHFPNDECLRLQTPGTAWSLHFGYLSKMDKIPAVLHSDDLKYVFMKTAYLYQDIRVDPKSPPEDIAVSNSFIQFITTFAEKGRPEMKGINWEPYTGNKTLYWSTNGSLEFIDQSDNKYLRFWRDLPFRSQLA